MGSTTVNGAPVSRQLIFHGDRIEAGNTRMRVQVQADRKSVRLSQTSFGSEMTGYELATSPNGISYYVAQRSAPPAAEVAEMLGGAFHRLLLVNPNKYPGPLPEQDNPAWHWSIQGRPGQRLLGYSPDDPINVTRILGEVWEHDAACLLLSRNRKGATMKQLKSVASAYLRPSLLRSQLHNSALPVVAEIMAEVCGVLTPAYDGTGWHLYAHPELAPELGTCRSAGTASRRGGVCFGLLGQMRFSPCWEGTFG